jgi:dephospho-CoA kinase
MQIIGLTGPLRAGKSSILKILEGEGFKGYKFSDFINIELQKRGLIITRKIQQDIGNELREKLGGDYWAKQILKTASRKKTDKIVIDGIRNPAEIKFLKKNGAIIVGINAKDSVRKKRFFSDQLASKDIKTEVDFNRANKRDRGIGENSFGQQVKAALRMADVIIENNGNNLEKLRQELIKKLLSVGIKL